MLSVTFKINLSLGCYCSETLHSFVLGQTLKKSARGKKIIYTYILFLYKNVMLWHTKSRGSADLTFVLQTVTGALQSKVSNKRSKAGCSHRAVPVQINGKFSGRKMCGKMKGLPLKAIVKQLGLP